MALIVLGKSNPRLPKRPEIVLLLIVTGFLLTTVRLGSLFFGLDETTSISGTVISAAGPIMLALLGGYFFHEHVTRTEKIGMMIAFIGTAISIVEPIFASGDNLTSTLKGNVIITFSLLVDITSILLGKYLLSKKVSPAFLTSLAFVIGFVTILPVALYYHSLDVILSTIRNASWGAHLGVWFMALISGTLAYYLHNRGLKSIEVGDASIFTYLSPIWAAPLALFWLGEKITGPFLFGAALIFIGVGIAEYKRRR